MYYYIIVYYYIISVYYYITSRDMKAIVFNVILAIYWNPCHHLLFNIYDAFFSPFPSHILPV